MCIYTYTYTCVCVYVYMYVCIHTHTHTHTQLVFTSQPNAARWGLSLGAFACLAVIFGFGTVTGLAARQMNLTVSDDEVHRALVAPAVAVHLLSQHGACLFSVMVRWFTCRVCVSVHVRVRAFW
jgi:hypothetical protein